MNNISDSDFDKLFREAAEKYEVSFDEGAWADMDQRLSSANDDGFGYYKVLSGIILVFIIGALVVWNIQKKLPAPENIGAKFTPGILTPGSITRADNLNALEKDHVSSGIGQLNIPEPWGSHLMEETNKKSASKNYTQDAISGKRLKIYSTIENRYNNKTGRNNQIINAGSVSSANAAENSSISGNIVVPQYIDPMGYNMNDSANVFIENLKKVDVHKQAILDRKLFGIKISFAPDLSSVGYFEPGRPGSNIGLIGEYFLDNRWSISAGLMHSVKIYSSNETKGYGNYQTTSSIDANCKVLDIPLNLTYHIWQGAKHGLYVSSGLSSYFMLRENYNYHTYTQGGNQDWSQELISQNNHFMGILNLSFGFERQLHGNFYVQVEPFLKAPLVGIGEGKVDLVSSGVFFNLKYQFSKRSK